MRHLVTHPSPYRVLESLPSFPKIEVSQDLATKALIVIAETCGMTVEALQGICDDDVPDSIDSLGLDSLLSIQTIRNLRSLGVEIPSLATGSYLVQDVFEGFLESFIVECIATIDTDRS